MLWLSEVCLVAIFYARLLVEPACGAALAVVENWDRLDIEDMLEKRGGSPASGPVLVIVCGGSAVSLEMINSWK